MEPQQPTQLELKDGRRLDLWLGGPDDGEPLLFHCGTPGSGLPFRPFVEALAARGLRYVSFSRAGYGSSTRRPERSVADVVEDAAGVLDHIGADRAYVLGWSGGGPHALACAALLQERVRGTALIGCVAPYGVKGLNWLEGMGAENVEEFEAALAGPNELIAFKERAWPVFRAITAGEVAEGLGDLVDEVDRGSIRGDFAEWLAAVWREGMRESYWGWFDDDMAFARSWGFDIASIQTPVHVWQGGHDRMVPFAHGQWIAGHVGGACAHLLPEHGHLTLAVDSVDEILDELTRTS